MLLALLQLIRDLDVEIYKELVTFGNSSVFTKDLSVFLAEWLILVFPLVLFYLWRRPHKTTKELFARKAVVMSLVAATAVTAVKTLVAIFLPRERPFVDFPDLLIQPITHLDSQSFPSGHAMLAFVVATSLYLSGFKRLGLVLFFCAILVALGRVLTGVHFPTDVVAGALVGVGVAYYFHREASTLKAYLPNN